MPEVAGEGAVLINPEQPQQIADALIKLENDADFYQKQVDYGLERVKLFSWRNTAEAYSKIYREIQKKQSLET
jgi:glycosyltransferase involved in cell wall biosynthesis